MIRFIKKEKHTDENNKTIVKLWIEHSYLFGLIKKEKMYFSIRKGSSTVGYGEWFTPDNKCVDPFLEFELDKFNRAF